MQLNTYCTCNKGYLRKNYAEGTEIFSATSQLSEWWGLEKNSHWDRAFNFILYIIAFNSLDHRKSNEWTGNVLF